MVYALEMLYIAISIVTHSAAVVNCIHSIALDVYQTFPNGSFLLLLLLGIYYYCSTENNVGTAARKIVFFTCSTQLNRLRAYSTTI